MAQRNRLLDQLGDLYLRGMARNVNALAEVAGKPAPDPRVYAPGAEWLPGIGDAVGFGQDVRGYIDQPNGLTPVSGLMSLAAVIPGVPHIRAKAGGEVAKVNGFFYKGGQFLPSTSEAPGFWKVGGKVVKARKREVSPGIYEMQPTPTAESLYQMAAPGAWSKRNRETGLLEFARGMKDATGKDVTPDMVVSKQGHTLQEVIDAYNSGMRWIDNGS